METVVVQFERHTQNNIECSEIEIPLSITANDLVGALNEAFNLGINREDYAAYYLCMENPIAFIRGEKTIESFGIRNGSKLIFKRKKLHELSL